MAFRKIQPLIFDRAYPLNEEINSVGENGFITTSKIDSAAKGDGLDVESFDLAKCIKAGVNIEEVNTKVL